MKSHKRTTLFALLALLACSACTNQNTAEIDQQHQVSRIKWEEVASASFAAKVSNSGMIMMR